MTSPPSRARGGKVLAIAALAVVLGASAVGAQPEFRGDAVPASSDAELTLVVPQDLAESVLNVEVVVAVPSAWQALDCGQKLTWACAIRQGDGFSMITFTKAGGAPRAEDETFSFSVHSAASQGTFTFPIRQRYSDGTVVDWAGPPDSTTPAPTVRTLTVDSEALPTPPPAAVPTPSPFPTPVPTPAPALPLPVPAQVLPKAVVPPAPAGAAVLPVVPAGSSPRITAARPIPTPTATPTPFWESRIRPAVEGDLTDGVSGIVISGDAAPIAVGISDERGFPAAEGFMALTILFLGGSLSLVVHRWRNRPDI